MGNAFLYGSGGGGSGVGGTLTVTTPAAGVIVSVTKDGKTLSRIANVDGVAVFKGLAAGTWIVNITNGTQITTGTVDIALDFAVALDFFEATISVTYPEGATCTCSNGSTTLTAADTSGSYTFTVPFAGDWTVACIDGTEYTSSVVSITEEGQVESVTLNFILYLFSSGDQCKSITGGWSSVSYDGSTAGVPINFASSGTDGTAAHYTVNAISLQKYKALYFSGNISYWYSGNLIFGLVPSTSDPAASGVSTNQINISSTGSFTRSVNLDSIGATKYHVKFQSGRMNAEVTQVWLVR